MNHNAPAIDSEKRDSTSKPSDFYKQDSQKKWWQWLIMYPTIFIALIGAIPTVMGYYKSWQIGVPFDKTQIASEQNRLWQQNYECSKSEFINVKNKNNIEIGTIICLSGDILIKIQPPDARPTFWWVGLKTFESNSQIVGLSLINQAKAEERPHRMVLAQNNSAVICQKWLDNGRLLRRVEIQGQGCFDEVVNTYTGQIEKRDSVSCDRQC